LATGYRGKRRDPWVFEEDGRTVEKSARKTVRNSVLEEMRCAIRCDRK
jgi:hypothetical protein